MDRQRIQAAADVLAIILTVLIILGLSWLIVCALTWGICWCFGWEWRAAYALGVWLLFILIKQFLGGK